MSEQDPKFVERLVCLANSRKSLGRCVAGKRVGDQTWIRPISNRPGHEISEFDRRYPDGATAQLLDVIDIPCDEARPHRHQTENVLIDDRFYWAKHGRASWEDIEKLVDRDANLWVNGHSAYYNLNNRVPEVQIDTADGSLRLIELDQIVLHATPKAPEFGNMKLTVRASFDYRGDDYQLDLTDNEFEAACLHRGAGDYPLKRVIVCVSLTEPHTNQNGETFAYKVVASIINKKRVDK